MIYTHLIRKAIGFAIQVHETDQKQKRKGKDIAYIVHPLGVGLILSQAGASEEIIVAGILHDTLEDSVAENKITKEILENEFGKDVADLVVSVTEQNKELPWEVRKEEALKHIENFSRGSLLVKSADIINNASELLEDYKDVGPDVFNRFNASKEMILKNYDNLITAILNKCKANSLAPELIYIRSELANIGSKQAGGMSFSTGTNYIPSKLSKEAKEKLDHHSMGITKALNSVSKDEQY